MVYKAFALSGRQACGHEYPGRCPGLGASAPSGREGNGRDAGKEWQGCGKSIAVRSTRRLAGRFKAKKRLVTIRLGVDFNEDIFAYFPFFLVAFKQKPPLNH